MSENLIHLQIDRGKEEELAYADAATNPRILEDIYTRWVTPVYKYLYSRTGNKEDAQDITSFTFLAVLQALPRYHHKGHFEAWLFTIARNQMVDFVRKHKHESQLSDTNEIVQSIPSPTVEMTQQDDIHTLRVLISSLREDEQELLRLRYTAGLAFAEIGLLLNRNEDAIKKSIYRLQEKLQKMLEGENE
jgi:RNA polymerase sigma-70 factor (ECF subfamily)